MTRNCYSQSVGWYPIWYDQELLQPVCGLVSYMAWPGTTIASLWVGILSVMTRNCYRCILYAICHGQELLQLVCRLYAICHDQELLRPVCGLYPIWHDQELVQLVCGLYAICHDQELLQPVCGLVSYRSWPGTATASLWVCIIFVMTRNCYSQSVGWYAICHYQELLQPVCGLVCYLPLPGTATASLWVGILFDM